MKIYLVDDDWVFWEFLKRVFPGLEIHHFLDGYSFFSAVEKSPPDRVIVDLSFDKLEEEKLISKVPSREGLFIVKRVREAYPEIPVLLVSRFGTAEIVGELHRMGVPFLDGFASEEVAKRKLQEFFGLIDRKEVDERINRVKRTFEKHGFYTDSTFILEQLMQLDLSESNRQSVLLVGETGTGKTFLAKVLHEIVFSPGAPFQEFNLTKVPDHLIESELFGYERGAFTGAYRSKPGYLELASGGTLLIDEIGFLNHQQQGKLLKAIEEGLFTRVGGTRYISSRAKIIGATSSEPAKDLREDLLYRFSCVIYLPPLRERREDVIRFLELYKQRGLKLTRSAEKFLIQADFPGNIRMLLQVLKVMKDFGREVTIDEAIQIYNRWTPAFKETSFIIRTAEKESKDKDDLEQLMDRIHRMLDSYGWNMKKLEERFLKFLLDKGLKIEKIASLLGVSRATVFRLKDRSKEQ